MRAGALAAIYLLDNISWFLTKPGFNLTLSFMAPFGKGHAQGKKCFCHHIMRADLPPAVRVGFPA